MLLSVTAGIEITASAATSTRDRVITSNAAKIKTYIKQNGFINGNGDYTLQYSEYDEDFYYYYLMIVGSADNALSFRLQLSDYDTDELFTVLKMDLSSPADSAKHIEAYTFDGESEWSVVGGHAYASQNYTDRTNNIAFYIDYNDSAMDDVTAINMYSALNQLAFPVWNDMLKQSMNLNLGALGFVNYCTGHKWNSGEVTKKATAKAAGVRTYTCTLCGATKTAKIAKNNFTAKGLKKTVKFAAVSDKNVTFKRPKVITIKNAKGKVTFKKSKGSKKIVVAKNGKITVKKGIAKGTYKVKIKVKAAGNSEYSAVTKTVTVTITVN